jgi:hypothetical protein
MSRRRPPELELELPADPDAVPELPPPLVPEELSVEYFVDVLEPVSCRTSVPKSEQSSHTSSSAPSTFTVLGEDVSAPHISHWTILFFALAPG